MDKKKAEDGAAVANPARSAEAASSKPEATVIHLTPMTSRKFRVRVRLGNGPDAPVVRPPATISFGADGRLQAVATPYTEEEADELDWEKKLDEMDDVDDDDDDEGSEEIDVDSDDSKEKDRDIKGKNDNDDDDVVYLGSVIRKAWFF